MRYGTTRQRYHLAEVSGSDLREAMHEAAGLLPDEVARTGDLVEIRPAADPEERTYLGEE